MIKRGAPIKLGVLFLSLLILLFHSYRVHATIIEIQLNGERG